MMHLSKRHGFTYTRGCYLHYRDQLHSPTPSHLVRRVTVTVCQPWAMHWIACRDSEGRQFCLPINVIRFGTNGIRKVVKQLYPNAKIIIQFQPPYNRFECSSNQGRVLRNVEFD